MKDESAPLKLKLGAETFHAHSFAVLFSYFYVAISNFDLMFFIQLI